MGKEGKRRSWGNSANWSGDRRPCQLSPINTVQRPIYTGETQRQHAAGSVIVCCIGADSPDSIIVLPATGVRCIVSLLKRNKIALLSTHRATISDRRKRMPHVQAATIVQQLFVLCQRMRGVTIMRYINLFFLCFTYLLLHIMLLQCSFGTIRAHSYYKIMFERTRSLSNASSSS